MNNSDLALNPGMGVSTAATSMTTIDKNDGIQRVEVTAELKLGEGGEFVDVERSGAGSGEGEDRPQLIELPYSLRVRKLKIAMIVLMVSLDGFLLPTCLFYVLKYAAHLSDARNVSITTGAFGFLSLIQYVLRLYRLLKPNSPYLPLHSPHRWYLDFYQFQFTLGFILITLVFVFALTDSQGYTIIRNTSLAPCILLLQCGPQFLVSCVAYKQKWVNKFRFSSTLAGEQCVPAVFTIVEDVVGVDGRGGGKGGFRELWKGRYMQSWRFREMIFKQTLFWGAGVTVGGAVTLAVVLMPAVNEYVAYGFGWCFPFVLSAFMIAITIKWVQSDLAEEKEEWGTADVSVIRGYQLQPVAS
ncbi:hypothetical protein EV426DRAFT_702762 [Tirmania nivea]|nr:hypothetical protein EV426DRAFT_702762 [Tirmania nivea]